MQIVRARFLIPGLASIVLLAGAAPALAAFSVSNVTATPSTTVAGGHPTLTVSTSFAGANTVGAGGIDPDTPKSLSIHLGPGLIGNPLSAPTCPVATFQANGCPQSTIVGSGSESFTIIANSASVTLPSVVYNVATSSPDQASQLGVQTLTLNPAPPPTLVPVSAVRTPVTISPIDLGLDSTTADNLTSATAQTGPIRITNITVALNAAAVNGFYMTNPTSCVPVPISASAASYGGTTSTTNATPFTPTSCATEPFAATLATQLDTTRTASPAQVGVTLGMSAADNPRRNAHVLASTVVLPKGMTLNPAAGTGLEACTDARFGVSDRTSAATCPASSQIGTVSFTSPYFLQTFTGPVYYGTQTPHTFNRLFVDVPIPGVHLKLVGDTTLNRTDGQVTTTFGNLPQIPFTAFNLTFRGGPRSVLTTPATCGTQSVAADLTPFSRLTDATPPDATPTTSFTTSYDGAGAACQSVFRPYFNGTLSNAKAGGTGSYALMFARPDRDTSISQVAFNLPAGLVGNLALKGLTQCTLSVAGKGACPASSNVGTASVQVGAGPEPATLPGKVFLTRHRMQGDPAGLSILVPAKLGPIDLGQVVVPARLQLRSDGGLIVTSTVLPQFQAGVPISIRLATITLNRAGFMRTPTSCGRKRYSGTFSALGGGGATTFAALTVSDCSKLGFTPRISATLGAKGQTAIHTHPPLTTTITQRGGQSAIRRAHVLLPAQISTNVATIDAACTPAQLSAGKCSGRAKVGTAKAVSPLLSQPLTGTVYLVQKTKGQLPDLIVQLRGPLAIDLDGTIKIGSGNKVATTFATVPDVPVTSFTLKLHGGSTGVLTTTSDLCTRGLPLPTRFTGQNGKQVSQRAPIAVKGCAKH
jgi:hypothetical protein